MTELNAQNAVEQKPGSQAVAEDENSVKDSHSRSLAKGLSWRVIASLTTVTIAWMVTGDTKLALEIGAIEVVAKIFIYYAHERIWLSV